MKSLLDVDHIEARSDLAHGLRLLASRQIMDGEVSEPDERERCDGVFWRLSAAAEEFHVNIVDTIGWQHTQAQVFGVVAGRCRAQGLRLRHDMDFLPKDGDTYDAHHSVTLLGENGAASLGVHRDMGTAALYAYLAMWSVPVMTPFPLPNSVEEFTDVEEGDA